MFWKRLGDPKIRQKWRIETIESGDVGLGQMGKCAVRVTTQWGEDYRFTFDFSEIMLDKHFSAEWAQVQIEEAIFDGISSMRRSSGRRN